MFVFYSHIFDLTYKHIVPTKSTPNARLAFVVTKDRVYYVFYKHIVPTGLKSVQRKEIHPNPPTNVTHYLTISYLAQLVKENKTFRNGISSSYDM